jgi:hypothetical protein
VVELALIEVFLVFKEGVPELTRGKEMVVQFPRLELPHVEGYSFGCGAVFRGILLVYIAPTIDLVIEICGIQMDLRTSWSCITC